MYNLCVLQPEITHDLPGFLFVRWRHATYGCIHSGLANQRRGARHQLLLLWQPWSEINVTLTHIYLRGVSSGRKQDTTSSSDRQSQRRSDRHEFGGIEGLRLNRRGNQFLSHSGYPKVATEARCRVKLCFLSSSFSPFFMLTCSDLEARCLACLVFLQLNCSGYDDVRSNIQYWWQGRLSLCDYQFPASRALLCGTGSVGEQDFGASNGAESDSSCPRLYALRPHRMHLMAFSIKWKACTRITGYPCSTPECYKQKKLRWFTCPFAVYRAMRAYEINCACNAQAESQPVALEARFTKLQTTKNNVRASFSIHTH